MYYHLCKANWQIVWIVYLILTIILIYVFAWLMLWLFGYLRWAHLWIVRVGFSSRWMGFCPGQGTVIWWQFNSWSYWWNIYACWSWSSQGSQSLSGCLLKIDPVAAFAWVCSCQAAQAPLGNVIVDSMSYAIGLSCCQAIH